MRLLETTAVLSLLFAGVALAESEPDACPGHAQEATAEHGRLYRELVALYAQGKREDAVASLDRIPSLEQCNIAHAIENAALAAQRGESGVEARAALQRGEVGVPPIDLRAAIMLHVDAEQAGRPVSLSAPGRTEEVRPCPGRPTLIASRYARLLARQEGTRAFARRFFLAVAHKCQWDACFSGAEYWAGQGLEVFPGDPEILLALGSVMEEEGTLAASVSMVEDPSLPPRAREQARAEERRRERVRRFRSARARYEDALAADERLAAARVRLGRVQWQLGDLAAAQATLEKAVEQASHPPYLYLARLFLGRVHEDAGRPDQAVEEYRASVTLDPRAQAAGVALSHALFSAGEKEEARRVLRDVLAQSGRRALRDAYWDYLALDAAQYRDTFAALRGESLR